MATITFFFLATKINDDHLNIDLNFSLSYIVVGLYRGTHILTFVTQIWLKGIFTNKSRFLFFVQFLDATIVSVVSLYTVAVATL